MICIYYVFIVRFYLLKKNDSSSYVQARHFSRVLAGWPLLAFQWLTLQQAGLNACSAAGGPSASLRWGGAGARVLRVPGGGMKNLAGKNPWIGLPARAPRARGTTQTCTQPHYWLRGKPASHPDSPHQKPPKSQKAKETRIDWRSFAFLGTSANQPRQRATKEVRKSGYIYLSS